jgi:hypothetical protein
VCHPENSCFQNSINDVFASSNIWFKANKLALNFVKTYFMKFATNSKACINLNISYDDKTLEELGTIMLGKAH